MRTESIPVTLLTGFLGAGKTTYLNACLQSGIPAGSLILVNDFGELNIDAELIEYRDEQILRLSNGCICCTLGGSLAEQLAQILRLDPSPAALYIEASGIANPARIVDTVTVSTRLRLTEVVCLVDASQAGRHARDPLCSDVWRRQIVAADRLVINRIGVDEPLPPVLAQVLGDTSAVIERHPSASAPAAAAAPPWKARPAGADGLPQRQRWQQSSFSYDAPIDGGRLESLFQDYADVLVRAKGIVQRAGCRGSEVLQWSGRALSWAPAVRSSVSGQLVCIGRGGERFEELSGALHRLGRR
ncbi:CobW family GTP-binding protein [Thauera mechernichensis]|uniref:CobW family GTP-binding protein n=1 Tax=Thauera mechernichensis TaxID=82788 RepID=A0ABW3W7H7_9RHOO|nr:CobW family GTP-binding protein [Thauera mechernichensis]MDG3063676.1 GTP-binding protein [Thauera mechernichensis]